MSLIKLGAVLFLSLAALAADVALPELRIEPTGGGSIFYVKNTSTQALHAYVIELVDYPGSSYSLWQDEMVTEPLAPKAEKRIQVANMTVGAVPNYVKIQAALYANGETAGVPERVAALLERRRAQLETLRELIVRLEKAQGSDKAELVASLKQWGETMQPPPGRANRNSQEAVNMAASRTVVANAIGGLAEHSVADSLKVMRTWEQLMAPKK